MQEQLVQLIQDLFERLPYELKHVAVVTDPEVDMTRAELDVVDGHELIGDEGETLRAIEYIIKRQLEQKFPGGSFDFHLDIDGYRAKQIEQLKSTAKIMAERAKAFEQDMPCPPMSAYERFIIHATLTGVDNITTASAGEGPDRHVIIHFSETKES